MAAAGRFDQAADFADGSAFASAPIAVCSGVDAAAAVRASSHRFFSQLRPDLRLR
jgi:hypothetical protein